MASDTPQDPLSTLPVDLLTDSLLPACLPTSLISLALTSRKWHTFLTVEGGPCEIVWQRKAVDDFRFPVGASGRRTGFFALYGRLARSAAYVWGQNDNGRLALPSASFRLPNSLRSRLIQGGIPIPTRLELPAPPVSLVAGGWSFHALTAAGQVCSWGQLDGESLAQDDAPLHYPGRVLRPRVLPQSEVFGEVVQLEAGRRHVLFLAEDGKVWELHSFGRAVEVRDEARRWGHATTEFGRNEESEVKSVQAGWDYSAVLTKGGDVYVWWQPGNGLLARKAAIAGESDLPSPSTQGVAFSLDLDTLRLPSLSRSSDAPDDKIDVLACGDNFLIALTASSQLYHLDLSPVPLPNQPFGGQGAQGDDEDSPIRSRASRARLEAEFLAGRRGWTRMSRFCDMDRVGELNGFRDTGIAPGTRITHVSAHYLTFAAYSVPPTSDPTGSIVLLGDSDWNEHKEPQVVHELQGLGVIKVAQGDYHSLALTSNGHFYSWGAFSGGALGLGHPQLNGTPLSASPLPLTSSSSASHAPPAPIFPAPQTNPTGIFPGFLPLRQARRVPHPPQRVDKPMRVRFHGEAVSDDTAVEGEGGKKGKFVYAIAGAGWHSGCLAVDLSPSSPAQNGTASEEDEPIIALPRSEEDEARAEMARLATQQDEERLNGERSWITRLGSRGVRVGLAGRGGRTAVGRVLRGGPAEEPQA
ncbi:hypothetical protein JCM8097_007944 [Rhodosporidiobolus ruineniae]